MISGRQHHYLKILPEYYILIDEGIKTFEIRFNDRNYKVGDILHLQEFCGGEYTGRELTKEICYMIDSPDYCKDGFVVLGVKNMMMKCRKKDCFSCPYPDCVNDYIPPVRKPNPDVVRRTIKRRSDLRKERASNGLCTECGKRPPREGYRMCQYCQAKARNYKNDENRRKGVKPRFLLDGITICQKCGKYPPEPNYKLCSRCLENCRKHLALTPTHNGKRIQNGFTASHERFWHND